MPNATEAARPIRETAAELISAGIRRHVNGTRGLLSNQFAISTVARQLAEEIGTRYLIATEAMDIELTKSREMVARLEGVLAVADGAWHSVWLHGRWRWLTKQMTTGEKVAAADAVERHWAAMEAADGEATHEASRLALRWWDTEQCHCGHRQEQHRALYGGWTVAELIDPFGGRCKDCDCARYRLTYVAPVLGSQADATRADSTGGGE